MLLKIVCLLMRWLFSLAVLVIRGDGAKNADLLVLRHENACCAGTPAGGAMTPRIGPGSPRSPGSSRGGAGLRREVLDRTLILNQVHLRAVLAEY